MSDFDDLDFEPDDAGGAPVTESHGGSGRTQTAEERDRAAALLEGPPRTPGLQQAAAEARVRRETPDADLDRVGDPGAVEDFLLSPFDHAGARDRTRRRIQRVADEVVAHPLESLLGAVHGATQGVPGGLLDLVGGLGDEYRSALTESRRVAPHAVPTAETVGALAPAILAAPETVAATGVGRMRQAALLGGGMGAAAGFGQASERDAPASERATQALIDAGIGALAGGTLQAPAEALGGTATALAGTREARDVARLSALRGTRRATLTPDDLHELVSTLGAGERGYDAQLARAADRVRASGVTSPLASAMDVRRRAQAAVDAAMEPLQRARAEFEATGRGVDVETVPRALERFAGEMETGSGAEELGQYAGAPRQMAGRWREAGYRLGTRDDEAIAAAQAALDRAGEAYSGLPPPPGIAVMESILNDPDALSSWRAAMGVSATPEESAAMARATTPDMRTAPGGRTPQPAQMSPTAGASGVEVMPQRPEIPQSSDELLAARQSAADGIQSAYMDFLRAQHPRRPLSAQEDALRAFDRGVEFTTPAGTRASVPDATRLRMRGVVRDAIDRGVAEAGGMAPETFRGLRQAAAGPIAMRDMAYPAAMREALISPLSRAMPFVQTTAAGGGGGFRQAITGAVGGYVRGREASLIASGMDLAQRVVERQIPQRLQRWAAPLTAAAARGYDSVRATLYTLAQSDPEARAAISEEESADESEPQQSTYEDLGFEPEGSQP